MGFNRLDPFIHASYFFDKQQQSQLQFTILELEKQELNGQCQAVIAFKSLSLVHITATDLPHNSF